MFSSDSHLIVYGSLAPGGPNHHLIAAIHGSWDEGWVTGDLVATGWGADIGFPALQWSPDGSRVPAWLLRSDELKDWWDRIDALEGSEYRRIRVPFHTDDGVIAMGYLYAAGSSSA
ncbi:MAG: gamma-glutamylcyclotransferase [Gemmatimonadota bacterium]